MQGSERCQTGLGKSLVSMGSGGHVIERGIHLRESRAMRIANLFGMVLAGFTAGVALGPAAHASGTLDQEYYQLPPIVSSAPITPALYYGTAVTPQLSGQLSQVDIYADRHLTAATQDLTMSIFATSGGLPTGSALATSSVVASTVTGNYDWISFNFTTPAQVQAGSQFAIVLTTIDSHANAYLWAGTDGITTSPYSGGYAAYFQAGSWNSLTTYSQMFRTYVTPNPDSSSSPAPVLQQFELGVSNSRATAACNSSASTSLNWGGSSSGSWGDSWAEWANGGKGGPVCTRTLVYSNALGHWIVG